MGIVDPHSASAESSREKTKSKLSIIFNGHPHDNAFTYTTRCRERESRNTAPPSNTVANTWSAHAGAGRTHSMFHILYEWPASLVGNSACVYDSYVLHGNTGARLHAHGEHTIWP